MKRFSNYFDNFLKWQKENRAILLLLLAAFVVVVITVPDTTTPGKYDRRVWISWANYMLENGLQNVYKLGVDYLPVTHYILYGYALLAGNTEAIILNVNSLKLFTFAIELVGVYYVYRFVREKYETHTRAALLCLVILFNPAFLYDSLLYGQWDGIYTTLVFMSFYYAMKNRLALSMLFFAISLNAKIQGLVYFPLVAFVCFEHLLQKFEPVKVIRAFVPLIIFQVLILLPFALTGDLMKVYDVAVNMVGRYPLISMGANNFWFFVFDNPLKELDVRGHWGLSYNSWGLLAFCSSMAVIFIPVLVYLFRKIKAKNFLVRFPVDKLLLIGILVPIVFFYFNTQMHARYAHSAILFGGCYALYTRRYLIYGLVSTAYFLNLEKSSKILKGDILEYQQFFMQPRFVAFLFGLVLVLGVINLYSSLRKSDFMHR